MTTSSRAVRARPDWRKACLFSGIVSLLCNVAATSFVIYELSKLGRFNEEYEMARTGGGDVHNKERRVLDPDEVEHFKRIAEYEETMVSVFLLLLIVTVVSSMGIIRGAAHKSRQSLVAWLVTVGPTCVYGSVLVTLDCLVYGTRTENVLELVVWIAFVAIEMICFRRVFRYYRQLARQQQCSVDVRRATAVFTISGVDSGGRIPTLTMAVSPPSYEEIIVNGTPKYTVTSDGRVVPDDTKPPDYTP